MKQIKLLIILSIFTSVAFDLSAPDRRNITRQKQLFLTQNMLLKDKLKKLGKLEQCPTTPPPPPQDNITGSKEKKKAKKALTLLSIENKLFKSIVKKCEQKEDNNLKSTTILDYFMSFF